MAEKASMIPNTEEHIQKSVRAINDLLSIGKVKNIIYIDDRFDIDNQKDEFIGLVNRLKKRRGRKPNIEFVDWNLPDPAFAAFVARKWDAASNQEREEYLNLVYSKLRSEDYVSISILDRHFGDRLKKITPTAWNGQKEQLFNDLGDNEKYLCLFDYELNNGRNGGELVSQLLNDPNASKVYCGIYSHTFSPDEEQLKKEEWADSLGVKDFYPISKKRLQDEPSISGFCNGVRNILLVRQVEALKDKSINLLQKSLSNVVFRIKQIHPNTFNSIIQKTSYEEGIWEIETLFRLSNILMDQETKRSIMPEEVRTGFNQSVNHIRAIDDVKLIRPDIFNKEQIKSIEIEEKYYSGEMLNSLHYPLRNGDIFNIKEKEYILLCQPCNLSLRYNGKRNNDIEQAFLVELKDKEGSVSDNPTEFELKSYNSDGLLKTAKFPTYKIVQLSLLDLVVYSKDGNAVLDLNLDENSLPGAIHLPWINRYKSIKKEYKKYTDIIAAFNKKMGGQNDREQQLLKNFIKSPKCLVDFKIDGIESYDIVNRKFSFPVKRIRHYKNAYAMELLKKFMEYLSRTGFDRDFVH